MRVLNTFKGAWEERRQETALRSSAWESDRSAQGGPGCKVLWPQKETRTSAPTPKNIKVQFLHQSQEKEKQGRVLQENQEREAWGWGSRSGGAEFGRGVQGLRK